MGDSGENYSVYPRRNVLKKSYSPIRVGLLLSNCRSYSSYIITNLKIIAFARVYVNLQLSVNKKFVAYGTMVKILATLKNLCTKGYYLIQKFELVIGRVYLSKCFGNKLFLPQFDMLKIMKILKIQCPIRNRKNVLRKGHLFFRAAISSVSPIIKEKTIAKTLEKIHPFNSRFEILYLINAMTQRFFKVAKILIIVPFVTYFPFTYNFKFAYTMANVFYFQTCGNICAQYLVTIPLCLEAKAIFQNVAYGANWTIFT